MPASNKERRLTAAIWALIDVFERAVAAHDGKNEGGMRAPYHGDFVNMPASSVQQMRRWARDLRNALKDEWPLLKEEYMKLYDMEDSESLDYLFRDREP